MTDEQTSKSRFAMIAFLTIGSIVIGVGRFLIPGHGLSWPGTYEAFAHIFVGVLLTLAFMKDRFALACVVLITVLEVVMAVIQAKT